MRLPYLFFNLRLHPQMVVLCCFVSYIHIHAGETGAPPLVIPLLDCSLMGRGGAAIWPVLGQHLRNALVVGVHVGLTQGKDFVLFYLCFVGSARTGEQLECLGRLEGYLQLLLGGMQITFFNLWSQNVHNCAHRMSAHLFICNLLNL